MGDSRVRASDLSSDRAAAMQIAFHRGSADCFLEKGMLSNRGYQLFPQLSLVPPRGALWTAREQDCIDLVEFARDSYRAKCAP